jgi:hypothetical protein
MTALIIIGCILLFLIFILSLRATLIIAYNGDVSLSVKVLFVKIKLFPKKDKKRGPHSMSAKKAQRIKSKLEKKAAKKRAKKQAKKEEKQKEKAEKKDSKGKGLSEILDSLSLIKSLLSKVLKKFFGHLKISLVRIKMKIAFGDASTTAIAYGAITQAINIIMPMLSDIKNFDSPKASDIDVRADFTAEESDIDVCICLGLRVWHAIDIGLGALLTFIKHKIKNADSEKSTEGHKIPADKQNAE